MPDCHRTSHPAKLEILSTYFPALVAKAGSTQPPSYKLDFFSDPFFRLLT